MFLSVEFNSTNVLSLILSDKRLALTSEDFNFLFKYAAQCGSRNSLDLLIKEGANPNYYSSKNNSYDVFISVIMLGNISLAKDLIGYGYTGCDSYGKFKIFKARLFDSKTNTYAPIRGYTYKEYVLEMGYKDVYDMMPNCDEHNKVND